MEKPNLKNKTSTVPADRSISKIERLLVDVGANNINKQYVGGVLKSITFLITAMGSTQCFKLPAKVGTVEKVLKDQVKRPQPGTYERIRKQSERTAWKIVCDWVEIQCTMIHLEQAEFAEVFLPYLYDPSTDQTLYQKVLSGDLKLLQ